MVGVSVIMTYLKRRCDQLPVAHLKGNNRPVDGTFGRRLRELRRERALSLRGLAKLVHFTPGHLSKVENDRARPTPRLAELCDAVLGGGGALARMVAPDRPAGRRRAPGHFCGLPRDTVHFVGRTDELAEIGRHFTDTDPTVSGAPAICVIHGMPGAGKTALALRVAHEIAPALRHGALFLDLHGFTAGVPAVAPADALDRLLRQLGVSGESAPPAIEDRAAFYRDRLRDRRILIVLDNVESETQVQHLLPASAGCRVLITSRARLAGLDDAHHVWLGPLPGPDARDLFRAVAGSAVLPDGMAAVAAIVDHCGRLPLAIRIAAARLRQNPTWTAADLRRRLAGTPGRLDELDDGARSVTAAFARSFEAIEPGQRGAALLLGLHSGGDLDVTAAAALTGTDQGSAGALLDRLVAGNLLDAHRPARRPQARYRWPGLLRVYAGQAAGTAVSASDRAAAVRRLVDYYLAATHRADVVLTPHRYRIEPDPPAEAIPEVALTGYDQALAWVGHELGNIVDACRCAFVHGLDRQCWQLAHALRGYFFITKAWDAWLGTHRFAVAAASRSGDRRAEAMSLNNLGLAHVERGELSAGAAAYQRALGLFRGLRDGHGIATSLGNRAWVHYYRGGYPAALADNERAFSFYADAGNRRNSAITLRGIGLTQMRLGRTTAAIDSLHTALQEFTALGLELDRAMTCNCLGEVHLAAGDVAAARRSHRQAIGLARRCGSRFEQTRADEGLAACTA
jgi:tetratricopeptide (TPR) repeat protein